MKLLFVTSHFGSKETIGFMPVVATELANRGHDVSGVQYEGGETIDSISVERLDTREIYTPYWIGQWLFYRDWESRIRTYLRAEGSGIDVVITDRRCTAPTIRAANALGVPAVGVIPGLGFTRFAPNNLNRDKTPTFRRLPFSARIQYPFVQSLHRQHQQGLHSADAVLVVSEFLQDRLKATYGMDSIVVRTPIAPKPVRATDHQRNTITMVNPRSRLKGAEIFLDIAEAMPDREFLVAGTFSSDNLSHRAELASNVTALGWVEDMREVYAKTALVLIPSIVEEGGPRVIAEAFVNDIPVVGTTRGGIPEFVGNAGVVVDQPRVVDAWLKAIRKVFSNYEHYADRAGNRSALFHIDDAVAEVQRILRDIVE